MKKCVHFSWGRIHSCPSDTARNQGSFTTHALLSVQSFLSTTVCDSVYCNFNPETSHIVYHIRDYTFNGICMRLKTPEAELNTQQYIRIKDYRDHLDKQKGVREAHKGKCLNGFSYFFEGWIFMLIFNKMNSMDSFVKNL